MKKTKWPRIHHIYDPIYKRNILYFKNWTAKKFEEYMLDVFGQDTDLTGVSGRASFLHHDNGEEVSVIWLREVTPQAVAHEVIHLALWTLDEAGVKYDSEHDEVLAYLVGFYVKSIHGNKTTSAKN